MQTLKGDDTHLDDTGGYKALPIVHRRPNYKSSLD